MDPGLRDEILVVADYGTYIQGKILVTEVSDRRKALGDKKSVSLIDFIAMLEQMVEVDDLLEPCERIPRAKQLFIRDRVHGQKALNLYYKLTPFGYREQIVYLDRLVSEKSAWRPKRKTGQS